VVAAERKAAARLGRGAEEGPAAKPRPEISDADYSTRFTSMRQSGMMALGQIHEKKGNAAAAEKTYREAYALSPKTVGCGSEVADYAKAPAILRAARVPDAATLAGRVTAASRAELETVYKQTHGGTPADLDRMLDERYEKER